MRTGVLGTVAALALAGCTDDVLVADTPAPAESAAAASSVAAPTGLSGEEQVIWNSLSADGKRIVSDCMAQGASLTACVSG